jgi:hypothetical protein
MRWSGSRGRWRDWAWPCNMPSSAAGATAAGLPAPADFLKRQRDAPNLRAWWCFRRNRVDRFSQEKEIAPSNQSLTIFFLQFRPHPPNLPHTRPRLVQRENFSRRFEVGQGRRLRLADNVTAGPGRLYPRVPRCHYGHCTAPGVRRFLAAVRGAAGDGSGTGAVFRTPDGVCGSATYLNYRRQDHTPCFP